MVVDLKSQVLATRERTGDVNRKTNSFAPGKEFISLYSGPLGARSPGVGTQ